MMKAGILGTSLLVVGVAAVVGGTWDMFTRPLLFGVNLLQVGGVLTAALGVAILFGFDPIGLESTVAEEEVVALPM